MHHKYSNFYILLAAAILVGLLFFFGLFTPRQMQAPSASLIKGFEPTGFRGPTAAPHIVGPTGNPPNY